MTQHHEHLAVIGIGCRFPGGITDIESYWEFLKEGRNAMIDIPADRWNWQRFYDPDPDTPGKAYVYRGGFLQEPFGYFDANFFGISPREAAILDPQQRLLLEVTWEAIENAGLVLPSLQGSSTGVYIGAFTLDNMGQQFGASNRRDITTHTAVSATLTMLANRISYVFDLRGPSIAIDTACSSSLVSLHLACQALWHQECEQAVAGGVNVMFRPEMLLAMCKGHFISPDGLCQAFDENANGYIRGEGAGVVILKPLSAAQRDGDPIHALICATGVNQDGRTSGITLPNSTAQEQLLLEVCKKAGITPNQLDYIEAHGTGTQAGDAAEAQSLEAALSTENDPDHICWVGSVKTNIGHLEAAAGIAGLIKTILCLKHQALPPHLHFKKLNPQIEFRHLRLPMEYQEWKGTYAGINSFGYGGTNAHAILKVAPLPENLAEKSAEEKEFYLLPLSARSEEALQAQIQQHYDFLSEHPDLSMQDYGYTLSRRRTHHHHRIALAVQSREELLAKLQDPLLNFETAPFLDQNQLVFVFTGMGPQWWGMGAELMEKEPIFRQIIQECDAIFRQYADFSLQKLFCDGDGTPMGEPKYAQPANFAIQAGLLALWKSYGITPSAVVGHSAGEIAAAYAANTLTLEDALKVTFYRSSLMQRTWGQGMMLATALSESDARALIVEFHYENLISLGAINSPASVVLSGDIEALNQIAAHLEEKGIFNGFLKLKVAYHSYQMKPLETEFMAGVEGLKGGNPSLPLYSTVTGELVQGGEQNDRYWWRNAAQPVMLQKALYRMIEDGYRLFLEVGPHPVLGSSIKECLAVKNSDGFITPSLRRQQPERETMWQSSALLYSQGYNPDWQQLYPTGNLISLPAYPWQKSYFWEENELMQAERLEPIHHPLAQLPIFAPTPSWESDLDAIKYLNDHQIENNPLFPAAGYVETVLATTSLPATIESLEIFKAIHLKQESILQIKLEDQRRLLYSRPADQYREWTLKASATLLTKSYKPRCNALSLETLRQESQEYVKGEDLYHRLWQAGYHYGDAFRGIQQLWRGDNKVLAQIVCPPDLLPTLDQYHAHPAILDACFQSVTLLLKQTKSLYLPISIQQIRCYTSLPAEVWCTVSLTRQITNTAECDLIICDPTGQTLMEINGLRLQALPRLRDSSPQMLYQLKWHEQSLASAPKTEGVWVIFADQNGIGEQIMQAAPHQHWIRVDSGREFAELAPDHFIVNPNTWPQLVECLPKVDKWLYLWHLDERGFDDTMAVLRLIQALHAQNIDHQMSHFYIVTLQNGVTSPGQMMLWGLGRVIANEHAWLSPRMIEWDGTRLDPLIQELLSDEPETEVALRGDQRYVHRLEPVITQPVTPIPAEKESPFALAVIQVGSFENLIFRETRRRAPGKEEVEVHLHTSGLNFKDIMKLMNLLPETYLDQTFYQNTIGLEGVGTIVAVGEGYEDFHIGDAVIVFAQEGTFRSFVTVHQNYVLPKPSTLTFEQSVIFINFITAYYALHHVGRLQAGERVLIHSATGGVGLAAIQIARWLGAEIYATTGTAEKSDYLRSLGIQYISDSRSLQFVDDVLRWTDGIDVVFNTLTGEALTKSFELLAPYGRFIEIGKRDISENNRLAMGAFDRNLTFAAVDLDRILFDRVSHFRKIALEVVELFEQGIFQPLPITVFDSDTIQEAFRLMGQSKHIGKVVVNLTPPSQLYPLPKSIIRSDGTYLVTGGLNGLGLETAKWLARAGAGSLVLVGRSGASAPAAQQAIDELTAQGIQVQIIKADVSDPAQVTALIEKIGENLRGVIHSAMVLDDDAMVNLNEERFHQVIAPKAWGAWYLHQATEHLPLDFFVLYSSVSSYIGNPRQANYVAANAFLDGLAHYRRQRGLPAMSINWGSIAEVGAVARNPKVEQYLSQLGLRGLSPHQAMQLLEQLLHENPIQITIMDIDWEKWANNPLIVTDAPLYQDLTSIYSQQNIHKPALLITLQESATADASQAVLDFLCEKIAKVTHIPANRIDVKQRLERLGFDSLMGIELSNLIKMETGIELSVMTLMRGLSVQDLGQHILEKMQASYPELIHEQ